MELNDKRIRIIVGHYGSGKTEFAVNYAVKMAELGKKTALVDLDIANTYFRSRASGHAGGKKAYRCTAIPLDTTSPPIFPAITARIRAF